MHQISPVSIMLAHKRLCCICILFLPRGLNKLGEATCSWGSVNLALYVDISHSELTKRSVFTTQWGLVFVLNPLFLLFKLIFIYSYYCCKWKWRCCPLTEKCFFFYQFVTCFGTDRPSSGDSWENTQMMTDYTQTNLLAQKTFFS
jgi:hypothetical protein